MQVLLAPINLQFGVCIVSPSMNAARRIYAHIHAQLNCATRELHNAFIQASREQRWLDSSRRIYIPSGG
jgi:hypothetical protein